MNFPELEKVNILIVDDKPENLLSLESLLDEPGLTMVRALSGAEALEESLREPPALILLDVQMPEMDGFEVARLLRGREATRGIPIIFVTATHRDEKFSFQGFESGAVDYLFKPLNPIVVKSKVRVFVELHRKNRRLEKALNELSAVNRELESFSYSVSHDLRAPARRVMAFSQILLEDLAENADPTIQQNLKCVIEAGHQMDELIQTLLELAQVTQGHLNREPVDLCSVVSQICNEFTPLYPQTVVRSLALEPLMVNADLRMMKIVLRNLLGNAFKFSSQVATPIVEFGQSRSLHGDGFFVNDNGVGFDMAYADRLFGAFQRLQSGADFDGIGIGLATVQRIIHRHGGKIWAESKPGQGAKFHFVLD